MVTDALEAVAKEVALVLVGRDIECLVAGLGDHALPDGGGVDEAQDAIGEGAGVANLLARLDSG